MCGSVRACTNSGAYSTQNGTFPDRISPPAQGLAKGLLANMQADAHHLPLLRSVRE